MGGHTQLNAATIAATDAQGKDTGNLALETETFGFADLSNLKYNKQQSANIGFSAAGTIIKTTLVLHSLNQAKPRLLLPLLVLKQLKLTASILLKVQEHYNTTTI